MSEVKVRFIHGIGHDSMSKNLKNLSACLDAVSDSTYTVELVDSGKNLDWIKLINEDVQRGSVVINFYWLRQYHTLVPSIQGTNILWFWFEVNRISASWLMHLQVFDEIWVGTSWAYEILIQHGVSKSKLRKIPMGVDQNLYFPRTVLPHQPPTFNFLFVGKFEPRKGLDVIIKAFPLAFPLDQFPAVRLLIKSSYFPARDKELRSVCSVDPRIQIIGDSLGEEQLIGLMCYAKCLVAPSRSEGFGMPALEAAACGIPILAVNFAGQSEYLDQIESSVYEIEFDEVDSTDSDFVNIYGADYGDSNFGTWAEPRIESATDGFKTIYERYSEYRSAAINNASTIIQSYSWLSVATQTREALDEVWSGKRPKLTFFGDTIHAASISILVQNNQAYLNWLIPTLVKLERMTATRFYYLFGENGSKDDTREQIERFLLDRQGELLVIGNTRGMAKLDRNSRIKALRNRLLDRVRSLDTNVDYVLDSNIYFAPEVFFQLTSSEKEPPTRPGLICAYGEEILRLSSGELATESHYYDTLAFRDSNNRRYWPHCLFATCRRCGSIETASRIQPKDFVPVNAAFGGLSAVKHALLADNAVRWGETGWMDARTEHDAFCNGIKNQKQNIYINSNAKVFWSENTI
jgi:glycosyltransferase involved in cell wall biosynthesis